MREKVHVYSNKGVLIIMCIPFSRNVTIQKEKDRDKSPNFNTCFREKSVFLIFESFCKLFSNIFEVQCVYYRHICDVDIHLTILTLQRPVLRVNMLKDGCA